MRLAHLCTRSYGDTLSKFMISIAYIVQDVGHRDSSEMTVE